MHGGGREAEGGQRICRDKSGWSARGEKDKMRQRKSSRGVWEREREDENRALKTTGLTRMKNEVDQFVVEVEKKKYKT